MEDPGDRPIFDPGDIVESPNGDLCVRLIEHIGEGRCCMVYSARTLRDGAKVALKVFKKGPTYDGAVQREQYILELFNDPKHNIGKYLRIYPKIFSCISGLVGVGAMGTIAP